MMNSKTPINEGGSQSPLTDAQYREVLEAQRLVLIDLLTPCDYPEHPDHPKEPHAYHSDDTYGDLEAALDIYHTMLDFFDSDDPGLLFNNWLIELITTDLDGALPDDPIDDEPFPNFSCDGVSGPFIDAYQTIHAHIAFDLINATRD